MTKKRTNQPQSTPRLIGAPRRYMNAAILVGGAVGLIVQSQMNVDDVGGFMVTGFFCFLAVIIVNFAWLIKVRREER